MSEEKDIEYEIRVDGCVEVMSTSLKEARHYFAQYRGDGENVELLEVERRQIIAQHNPDFDLAKHLMQSR